MAVEGGKGGREALRPADRPALVAELQRLLLVLFHLGLQLPHRVLELGVLPEEAPLAGSLLSGALRGACGARAVPALGRRKPGEMFSGGAKADTAQMRPSQPPASTAAGSHGGRAMCQCTL